jgi:hypothetical protein
MRRFPGRAGLLLAVSLIGGCSSNPFSRPYAVYDNTSPDTLRGQCERAAYDDPAVRDELAKQAGSANYAPTAWDQRLAAVKRQAVQRCMYQHGGPGQGGGVELPRQ